MRNLYGSQDPDDLGDSAGAGCGDSQGSSQPGPDGFQDESQVPGNLLDPCLDGVGLS